MATARSYEELLSEKQKKLRAEIEKKTGKTPEQLYEEREKRVREAIQLQEADRIPVSLRVYHFPAPYTGTPIAAAYYNQDVWKDAVKRTIVDFEPDLYQATAGSDSGEALELLAPRHVRWPGGELPPDVSHQAIEQEYMKEDEYDLFLFDPSDYTLRYLLPRAFGALAPLTKLPAITDRFTGFAGMTPMFTREEFRTLARILVKAGEAQEKSARITRNFEEEMAELGHPPQGHGGGVGGAPFDAISDYYRGMRGAMTDMYRCPDKLLAACDKVLEWRMRRAAPADPRKRGNPKRLQLPLHRGAEGFMSRKQFETFYWPGLKKSLLASISLGFVPMPYFEGGITDRLEYLLELPKGKAVIVLDRTDMKRAKEVLRDHLCIMGNVPSPLLALGSPPEVEEYCKDLFKTCGKGGGFILSNGSAIDDAKPENIRAMMDAVQKYGWY